MIDPTHQADSFKQRVRDSFRRQCLQCAGCRAITREGGAGGTRIEQRISHVELSRMVGTTRPRIGIFLKKFRELGLIRLTSERFLVIDQDRLREYAMGRGDSRRQWLPEPQFQPLLAEPPAPQAILPHASSIIRAGRKFPDSPGSSVASLMAAQPASIDPCRYRNSHPKVNRMAS